MGESDTPTRDLKSTGKRNLGFVIENRSVGREPLPQSIVGVVEDVSYSVKANNNNLTNCTIRLRVDDFERLIFSFFGPKTDVRDVYIIKGDMLRVYGLELNYSIISNFPLGYRTTKEAISLKKIENITTGIIYTDSKARD